MDAIDPRVSSNQDAYLQAYARSSYASAPAARAVAKSAAQAVPPGDSDDPGVRESFATGPNREVQQYSARSVQAAWGGEARGPQLPAFDFSGSDDESLKRMDEMRRSGLADELRDVRKGLKAESRELREGGSVADKARVYGGLRDVDTAIKGMDVAHRAAKWDEVNGAVEGTASSVYKSYFVHGKTPVQEMKQVLQTAKDLENPDSAQRLKGNDVQPLVRDEIWHTKMQLLENASQNPTPGGQPLEIDAEYYELASSEMVDKLCRASNGGAKVKVLMDPGQISRMSGTPDATSMASRLNTLQRLEEGSGGKVAVQLFANSEVLGGRDEIMHRKLLRVGDEVVFGGMNANSGSGENVDFGMKIAGPGAGRFVDIFKQDVELSRGRSAEAIYGQHISDLRAEGDVVLQPRGVVDLLEAQLPGGSRSGESNAQRAERVLDNAAYAGIDIGELVTIPTKSGEAPTYQQQREWLIHGRGEAVLTEKGKNLLADGLEQAIGRMNGTANQEGLQDISRPDVTARGEETLAVGNTSVERQAMVLHAIDSADEYVKVSAFVLNEDVARLLVEKKASMNEAGKPFDVQVVLDPGVYGYGGSPNEKAYKLLEDNGVDVKWAALDRSSEGHDRKVHAKLMITDKMMVAGSTNFSHKGLRDNWELSDITFFNDEASKADQAKAVADFEQLWGRESLGIDTRAVAEKKHGQVEGPEGEYLRDSERTTSLRKFLRGIGNLEKDIGRQVDQLRAEDPMLEYSIGQKVRDGQAEGYAVFQAVGQDRLTEMRHGSKAWRNLQEIRQGM